MKKDDKLVEDKLVEYFNTLEELDSYKSKLKYYEENINILNIANVKKDSTDIKNEINKVKLKIVENEFKYKHIENFINSSLTKEEKEFIELRYRKKLTVIGVRSKLYMCEKTYYKVKKEILEKLKVVVL
ncbi:MULTISPECIES: hypothetical protein [Clostridium]|uniref:hypothetical protein n=1 Tax=Clostridium TaxID=1485 RepID=UPI0008257E65|nr:MULTISPECIES: hypothetical protein [Clostridium]PJI06593.1 hypothetical protein CUB90_01360 [Clostridium sp. CT7]